MEPLQQDLMSLLTVVTLLPVSEPQDCRVREWSEWSPCSKTCGFGVRTRSRDVLAYSKNGGFSCPILHQELLLSLIHI